MAALKTMDLEEIIERYAIMRENGNVNEVALITTLERQLPPHIFNKLIERLSPYNYEFNYIQLREYVKCGFAVYPCVAQFDPTSRKYIYKHFNYLTGEFKLYKRERKNSLAEASSLRVGVNDLKTLWQLSSVSTVMSSDGQHHKLNMWRIFPGECGYIVFDIDRHGDGVDGVAQWRELMSQLSLSYGDVDSFPCYVSTPRNGYHLYFRLPKYALEKKFKNSLTKAIEIKTANSNITAGGSIKLTDEYMNIGCYVLHGRLESAPLCPHELLERCYKKTYQAYQLQPAPQKQQTNKRMWFDSIDGIIEKARTKSNNSHEFIYLVGCYASLSNREHGTTYDSYLIFNSLMSTPEGRKAGLSEVRRTVTDSFKKGL